jgi:hypothetical protein
MQNKVDTYSQNEVVLFDYFCICYINSLLHGQVAQHMLVPILTLQVHLGRKLQILQNENDIFAKKQVISVFVNIFNCVFLSL